MTDDVDSGATLEEPQLAYHGELDTSAAAVTSYALGFRYRNEDVNGERRFEIAKIWAQRAVTLLDALPSDTLDQVSSTRQSVGGVPLPELLLTDVVRQRLEDVLI